MLSTKYVIKKIFELAKKGEGFVSPNPLVGAAIAKKSRIISFGYHKKVGLPHAEIEAINKANQSLRGATLYINLEPCCHWGKTPPCVDEIISRGIKKVIVSTADPNPKVGGRSIKRLKRAGITVKVGVLKQEAIKLNEVFFKNMKEKLPFVVVKIAQSLDGKIATKTGKSKWITSFEARRFSKVLRDKYDAVLVGVNTVIKDDPTLEGVRKTPYKIVIDPELKIPLNSKLVKKFNDKLIIFFSQTPNMNKLKTLSSAGTSLFPLKRRGRYLNLKKILKIVYSLNIMSIFVEGGSITIGRLFDEQLVDKVYFFLAPKIIGGEGALISIRGKGIGNLKDAIVIKDLEIKRLGKDFLISGYPKYH